MTIDIQTLQFALVVLGNCFSFMVFLAPLPTFYKIYKRKSSEGFQCLPYVVALLSSMLWIYYAFLHTGGILLTYMNSFGCVFETAYVIVFMYYAASVVRIQALKLLLSLNVIGFGLIVALTLGLVDGANRIGIVQLICLVFDLCVYAAPLGIIRQVMRTKSVEFMPFSLSVILTLSAHVWLFYGLIFDFGIVLPNLFQLMFGLVQILIYTMYMDSVKEVLEKKKIHEWNEHTVDMVKLGTSVWPEILLAIYPVNKSKADDDRKVAPEEDMRRDHSVSSTENELADRNV